MKAETTYCWIIFYNDKNGNNYKLFQDISFENMRELKKISIYKKFSSTTNFKYIIFRHMFQFS